MFNLASESTRTLPASPVQFGVGVFVVFVIILYIVLRLDN